MCFGGHNENNDENEYMEEDEMEEASVVKEGDDKLDYTNNNNPAMPAPKAKSIEVLSGRSLKRITWVPLGTTLSQHLEDLKNQRSDRDEYTSLM